jgi:hypothetical protein
MTHPHPAPRSSPGHPRGSPRPQRAHRHPVTTSRSARMSDRHLAALATRLTPRDLLACLPHFRPDSRWHQPLGPFNQLHGRRTWMR